MLSVGDTVVTMSYRGVFVVIAIDGDDVTIRDDAGTTRTVRRSNVRRLRSSHPATAG
jgi:preprotein translocase subunit YajC